MKQVSHHLTKCLEKISTKFGKEWFSVDDISPILFSRAQWVCTELCKADKLKWKVTGEIYNLKSFYKIKSESSRKEVGG